MTSRTDLNTQDIKDRVELLSKLQDALRADGDFPVRAKVISDLFTLANNPNASVNQVTDVILREPSLGTRILHLVNTGYYHRGQPILTISQAVVQIGMRTLCNLCAGLVLIHKFLPAAKRGAIFADNIKRTILSSLLASALTGLSKDRNIAEKGYLAGTFYHLGYLLLGYYFPQVYDAAGKRAEARKQDIVQSITELLGVSPADLNLTIVEALEIPDYYKNLLKVAYKPETFKADSPEIAALVRSMVTAGDIAHAIVNNIEREPLEQLIAALAESNEFTTEQLKGVVAKLPAAFKQHCEMIELGFLSIPAYLAELGTAIGSPTAPKSA